MDLLREWTGNSLEASLLLPAACSDSASEREPLGARQADLHRPPHLPLHVAAVCDVDDFVGGAVAQLPLVVLEVLEVAPHLVVLLDLDAAVAAGQQGGRGGRWRRRILLVVGMDARRFELWPRRFSGELSLDLLITCSMRRPHIEGLKLLVL